jgi:hypothetical protein
MLTRTRHQSILALHYATPSSQKVLSLSLSLSCFDEFVAHYTLDPLLDRWYPLSVSTTLASICVAGAELLLQKWGSLVDHRQHLTTDILIYILVVG